jgi:hypothetical protein
MTTIATAYSCGNLGERYFTSATLKAENGEYRDTAGVSEKNRRQGFYPAFWDGRTGAVHLSRFADGRLAPVHVLDGLPSELVAKRLQSGRVVAAVDSVVAGFVRQDRFYTRREAAAMCET